MGGRASAIEPALATVSPLVARLHVLGHGQCFHRAAPPRARRLHAIDQSPGATISGAWGRLEGDWDGTHHGTVAAGALGCCCGASVVGVEEGEVGGKAVLQLLNVCAPGAVWSCARGLARAARAHINAPNRTRDSGRERAGQAPQKLLGARCGSVGRRPACTRIGESAQRWHCLTGNSSAIQPRAYHCLSSRDVSLPHERITDPGARRAAHR